MDRVEIVKELQASLNAFDQQGLPVMYDVTAIREAVQLLAADARAPLYRSTLETLHMSLTKIAAEQAIDKATRHWANAAGAVVDEALKNHD